MTRTLRMTACLFTFGAAAFAQAPKHMLYRVRGPHGATVYLLGSVHLLSPEASALPAVVDSAFAHATVLALETNLDSVMTRAPELLAKAQLANGATLRSSLSSAGAARLDTILRSYGLTIDQLNGFKPWFVSMVMSQVVMQRANFQAQYGVDVQLNARAHEAGKPVMGLESVEFQLGLFDSISPADQERMVLETEAPDSAAHELTRIKDAWLAGDGAKLDSLMNTRPAGSEGLYDLLVTRRNKAWIPKLVELVDGHDDALVVVGAAHLVGKEGVIELLRAKGYTVEQL
jgi:uncharacterized protein